VSAPQPESSLRRALTRGAHLLALSAFALAQPLLDILGKNAAFFAVRGSSPHEIVLFALAVTFALPATLLAAELLADLVSRAVGDALHLVFVAGLAAVIVLHALTKADALSGVGALVVSAAVGIVAAAVYRQAAVVRSFVSVLGLAPLLFLGLFLFNSSVEKLVFVSNPKVAEAAVKSKTPVVLVVFDELTTVSLMDRHERIDATRYPNFAALARDSTWYRSGTTADWLTEGNVPAILTGRTPVANKLPIYSEYPHNLFTLLGKSYRLRVMEAITHLCPKSVCKDSPKSAQAVTDTTGSLASDAGIVYLHLLLPDPYVEHVPPISDTWGNFGGHTQEQEEPARRTASGKLEPCGRRVCEFADLITADRTPTLYFYHSVLPHWPFVYLPSGHRWTLAARPLDAYKEGHWLQEWPALQGQQRYLLQLGYTDRALGLILRKLKATGVYDRALVIVTADEGESFRGGSQRRRPRADNLDDIGFVPLFVKLPHQTQGRIEDGLAPSIDIFPTIAHVLHVRVPWKTDGQSLVGRRLPRDGKVSVLKDVQVVSAQLSALRAKRTRTLAEQAARFGTGSFDGVYRFGPHRELIGRSVSGLSVRPSSRTHVQIENRTLFDNVDPDAELLPNFVAGSLAGAGSRQLDLAVGVNGKIEATTKTFTQEGQTRFAAFVPEDSLHRGKNAVDVFAIVSGGAKPVLEELRGGDFGLVLREREGHEEIASAGGKRTRIDPKAIAGTVQASATKAGFEFEGKADTVKPRGLVDTIVVFAGGKAVFVGRASDLRPLKFLGAKPGKDRFDFELPSGVLPAAGQDHSVRVFAVRARVASELGYRGSWPWGRQ
jgi:Sulfatase